MCGWIASSHELSFLETHQDRAWTKPEPEQVGWVVFFWATRCEVYRRIERKTCHDEPADHRRGVCACRPGSSGCVTGPGGSLAGQQRWADAIACLKRLRRLAALHWLSEGWGYEVTSADVVEAHDRAMGAASRLNKIDDVTDQVRQLVASKENASMQFVRQALQARIRTHSSSVNGMVASKS